MITELTSILGSDNKSRMISILPFSTARYNGVILKLNINFIKIIIIIPFEIFILNEIKIYN